MSHKGLGLTEREELRVCSFYCIRNESGSSSAGVTLLVFPCNNSLENTFCLFYTFTMCTDKMTSEYRCCGVEVMSILIVCAQVHVFLLLLSLTYSVISLIHVFVSFCGKYPKLNQPLLILCQYQGASIVPTKLLFQHPITHLSAG